MLRSSSALLSNPSTAGRMRGGSSAIQRVRGGAVGAAGGGAVAGRRAGAGSLHSQAKTLAEASDVPFLSSTLCPLAAAKQRAAAVAELPFRLPHGSWIGEGVGNTPCVELEDGLWAKLEGHNPGGSLKDRTLSSIILHMFRSKQLRMKGDTLCLVTSGSAGVSLEMLHRDLMGVPGMDLDVVIVMPEAYAHKEIPAELIDMPSTTVYRSFAELEAAKNAKPPASHAGAKKGWGSCSIVLAEGAFIDVLADARVVAGAAGWNMLEQHSDANSIEGHRSTATEIMQQIPGVTDVVCSTGTGATAAGLRAFLPENVKVHARPAISGSIDGLSDVNRYNNFCDTSKLENYNECVFDKDTAVANTQELQEAYGIVAGPSSGACWWLAKSILERDPSKKVATICADGSLPPSAFRERQQTVPRTWSEEIQTLTHRYGPVDVPPQDFSNGLWSPLPRRNGRKRHARSHNRHTSRSRMSTMVGGLGVRTSRHAGRPDGGRRAMSTSVERGYPPMEDAKFVDNIVIGGGPVGASAAWFLAETEAVQEKGESVMCIFDPKDKGAHEDWSRLARLSFDGPREEFDLSHHALETLERIEEVRSMQSGQPVVPIKPGMLFLASPGTPMALACANGEANYGDDEFVRRSPDELGDLYPGNNMEIPKDTLCWTHPAGLCVSPLELAGANLKTAGAYGVSLVESRAQVDVAGPDGELLVTLENGEKYSTKRCFLFAGARSKEILAQALERNPEGNAELSVPEFDDTYISAISTVRYRHRNTPSGSDDASVCVAPPITLGQLDGILPYQANFSVVAEEYGDVLKTRLSGDVGTETIDDVGGLAQIGLEGGQDAAMAETYSNFFCSLFPYLDDTPLDFNRCVTYRNHNPHFSGTSLLQKSVGSSSLYTSVGCFGVGVKFGPVLGEAAAAHAYGEELHEGMHVFASGSEELAVDESVEQLERAW